MAGIEGLTIVHVTHFNALFWDCGPSPVTVIEHGIPDPGPAWTGELNRAAVVVNDPLTRGPIVGNDLLPGFAAQAPLDVFGMRVTGLARAHRLDPGRCREYDDLPQARLHTELPRRRVYVHPFRWTSLGLSLIEAMFLAMPVVVLAVTEAPRAVPPAAGAISTDVGELHAAVRRFARDPAAARDAGLAAREAACARYGLKRFLRDWDQLLQEVSA
jgi:glycosyltransferase involved in cell wall biosynthesis